MEIKIEQRKRMANEIIFSREGCDAFGLKEVVDEVEGKFYV